MKRIFTAFSILILIISSQLFSQNFSVDEYSKFLEQNKNLSVEGLYNMYPPGIYTGEVRTVSDIKFYDEIKKAYELTEYEEYLIQNHDFMVSERLSYKSFWSAFSDVFSKDMPVFISTDAILHSVHMSYDAILRELEESVLIPKMQELLQEMYSKVPDLMDEYKQHEDMIVSVNDIDVYLTVARNLIEDFSVKPKFEENQKTVDDLLNYVANESPAMYPLFWEIPRRIDFSQFTPRGHYTLSDELKRYFRTMMWLGRTEIYLITPQSEEFPPPAPHKREIIDAALILEAAESTGAYDKLKEIDGVIRAMIGESDNVKIENIREILDEAGINSIPELLNDQTIDDFIEVLVNKPYSEQKILSQILMKGPYSPLKLKPASAFMLFGQRFIIDSYVTGSVVWDKTEAKRMLPSSLDVLFALGNNAAGDLLKDELEKYQYSSNLSGLRYLIDSYTDDFWESSYYAGWLNAIRTLNPPDNEIREDFPAFMQTAAWWQEKMNTQLSSWAQLRHDNLLYAKQSYSGGVSCEYPCAYLEPVPEFYKQLGVLSRLGEELILPKLDEMEGSGWKLDLIKERMKNYFNNMADVSVELTRISGKELAKDELTQEEKNYLRSIFHETNTGCVMDPDSWYAKMFYVDVNQAKEANYVIADVHTAPTDKNGAMVGWVWHVGTGKINMGIWLARSCEGDITAFAGPVMSYYDYTSLNFKRWTDEEWKQAVENDQIPGLRPKLTNLYLADKNGEGKLSDALSLPVGVEEELVQEAENQLTSAFPNPFTRKTRISFKLPDKAIDANVSVNIYNSVGSLVKNLFSDRLSDRNFIIEWDGLDDSGKSVPAGIYIYSVEINGIPYEGKLVKN